MQTDRIERLEQRTESLERRVDRIEQVLPTLATKADLRASEERMRTHFNVVTESLRHDIRLVAEAVAALSERVQ